MFWVWLAIAIITTVARAMKKRSGEQAEQRRDAPEQSESGNKPMTFEELLREIQTAKNPAPPKQIQPAQPIKSYVPPKSYDVDYDEDIGEEEKDYETVTTYDYSKSNEVYEQAKAEAFNRKSLEETLKVEDTEVKFGHFKGYESQEKENVLQSYVKELADPDGFKKAFIMSEILKRKF